MLSKASNDHRANNDHRTAGRVAVDLLLNKYMGGRPHLARASNLSRRGLLVHRLFEPRSDERAIGLQFQLPSCDRVITCAGRIVHSHPWIEADGIELTDVAPQHQRLIDAFLERHAGGPAIAR
ncbi:MAG: PilZ domain-containing protein [Proteobacteria bacterium]|nr:PilZ domain-containing protein [Pseudomonadota bacterium]